MDAESDGIDVAEMGLRAARHASDAEMLCEGMAWSGRCVGPDGAVRPATDWERARIALAYACDLIDHANRGLGHAAQGPETARGPMKEARQWIGGRWIVNPTPEIPCHAAQGPEVHAVRQPAGPGDPPGP